MMWIPKNFFRGIPGTPCRKGARMTRSLNQLLRRTFLAGLALAAAAGVSPAFAGSVKNQDTGATICSTFTGINVDPLGGLAISGCSATSTAGPAGAFDFQINATTYPGGALALYSDYTNMLSIVRSGGTTGGVTVSFTRSGGCGPLPLNDTATFANGATSAAVEMKTPNNAATCKATITAVTPTDTTATSAPTIGTTMPVATMTVSTTGTAPTTTSGGGGGGGGTTSNCPAPDPNGKQVAINPFGVDRFAQPSGAIYWAPLPSPTDIQTYLGAAAASAKVQFGDMTGSPSTAVKEIWISHCPGVFDSNPQDYAYVDQSLTDANPGRCYVMDNLTGDVTALNWFANPGADPAYDDQVAQAVGICEAYASKGPWYINYRWTYDASACPWGQCGFTGQWNASGYSP